ncbi:phospho-N-acetylmuramoyl-pentapeptide-transferase [Pseudothermotoga sp. U03pept]|uniref:phospho-N-acetylmuramoyl-pentapeptide- transferase n=1 Tax=Pseudothermotoga sp. U03pept TaxID=3447012 RepID=UPI003F04359F
MILLAVADFLCCVILYPFFIKFLRFAKIGQFIREEGPDLHGYKAGTPTMGGILFLLAAAIFSLLVKEVIDAFALISFGFIGFLDDFLSVRRKKSLGLRAWQKFTLQILFSVFIFLWIDPTKTKLSIPFTNTSVDLGYLYPIFAILLITGLSNAVNLTDGLDGLAGSVFVATALPYWFLLKSQADSLLFALISVMTFLFFNIKPAKVFMGDTGALALGALLGTVAIRTSTELIVLLFSSIFVAETVSVILQVSSFKLFRKRIFKMSPIHHHFELLGWKEERIVQMFSLTNLTIALITLLGVKSM